MERNRKRVTASRIAAAPNVLLAGAALYTASGSEHRRIQVKEYAEAAEAVDSTITVYTNGGDLEGDYGTATANLWEMVNTLEVIEQEGKSPSLHVMTEAGDSARWELDEMDGAPYARFPLTGDGISSMESMEIRNMGDADTLMDFINYGVRFYPVNHYGLILWNHGGSPVGGYGSDSHFNGDGLSLEEIREVLGRSVMADSVFGFVAFDACLTGSVKAAGRLDGYAGYAIASSELEPQHGYDYRWMAALEDSLLPNMEWGEAVGRPMVEVYGTCYASGIAPVAMSLLGTKEYPAFHEVFHQYADGIPEKLREELCGELGGDRTKMLAFGSKQADGSPELVDVLELLNACQRAYPGENVFQTLKDRMRGLVAKQRAKGYPVNPSDLTIYLPSGSNPYLSEAPETYDTMGSCSAHGRLIDGYAAYPVRESGVEQGSISAHKDGTVEISIAPEDVSDVTGAYLAVFHPTGGDENYYLLCTDSDVDIGVDGTLWTAPEGSYMGMKGQVLCLVETVNLDAYVEYTAPVLYNGELCIMRIGFDEEYEDGQTLSVIPTSQTFEAAKQIYELEEEDRVTPLYPVERMEGAGEAPGNTGNASGQIMEDRYYTDSYYMGTEFHIEEPDDMLLEAVPVSEGGYLYGFMLMDVRQNIYYMGFIGMRIEDNGP